jgi:hypothetical protein
MKKTCIYFILRAMGKSIARKYIFDGGVVLILNIFLLLLVDYISFNLMKFNTLRYEKIK